MQSELMRPIVGIENRTAQEVFDIMCDRIKIALSATVPSVAVKALEWDESQNHAYNSAFGYQIAVIGDRVVLRCPLSASSEHENIQAAKEAANEHHLARIVPALSAQVQDVATPQRKHAFSLSDHEIRMMSEGTMIIGGAQMEMAREIIFLRSLIPAAPAKQEG